MSECEGECDVHHPRRSSPESVCISRDKSRTSGMRANDDMYDMNKEVGG